MKIIKRSNLNKLFLMLEHALDKEQDSWIPNSYSSVFNVEDKVDANIRDETIRWLFLLSDHLHLTPETAVLSANILDSFLCVVKARPKYLQCIGVACLFLAAKLLEEDEVTPSVEYLVEVTACTFSVADILRMEKIILNKLEWNVRRATALDFIYILHAIIVCEQPNLLSKFRHMTTGKQLTVLVQKILMCQESSEVVSFSPSTQALALISLELGLCTTEWFAITIMLQKLVQVDNRELIQCREAMTAAMLKRVTCTRIASNKRKMEDLNEEDDIYGSIKCLYGEEPACVQEAAQENVAA
uniref:Cyclin-like domain-containing protein n=1 Tax=Strigamia maritima TaxID=126957 RepID=T1JAU6_STRMM